MSVNDVVAHKMVAHINVFSAAVVDVIFRDVTCTLVVNVDWDRSAHGEKLRNEIDGVQNNDSSDSVTNDKK